MIKCSNCASEMIEDYKLKVTSSPLANIIASKGGAAKKIKVFICPSCGKIDLYSADYIDKGEDK